MSSWSLAITLKNTTNTSKPSTKPRNFNILLNANKCFPFSRNLNPRLQILIPGVSTLFTTYHRPSDLPAPKTVGQLQRFFGMLNFCWRFLPHTHTHHPKLLFTTSFPALNSRILIMLLKRHTCCSLQGGKAGLSQAALLAYSQPTTPLTLVTDTSTSIMGTSSSSGSKTSGMP